MPTINSYSRGDMQIIGDTEKLALVVPDQGIFFMINPLVTCVSINLGREDMCYSSFGGDRVCVPGIESAEATITIRPDRCEFREGETDLLDFDFFRNKTIKQLFNFIEKKIKERTK